MSVEAVTISGEAFAILTDRFLGTFLAEDPELRGRIKLFASETRGGAWGTLEVTVTDGNSHTIDMAIWPYENDSIALTDAITFLAEVGQMLGRQLNRSGFGIAGKLFS